MSTKQEPDGVIVFSKKQFNVRLRFPLSLLFKQFLHFTKIPHAFLHPNIVRILMGCSMLNMLYHLDISLLEVLFIYTIKMSKKEIFSLSADISSLQLVIGLLDSTKGAKKGYVVVSGPCDGPYEHPDHPFELRRSLGIPGRANCHTLTLSFIIIGLLLTYIIWCTAKKRRRGRSVKWVDKTSFDRLNKLFVIFTRERNHKTLLTEENLLKLVWDPKSYVVLFSLPHFASRVLVPGEYYVVKDLPFYEKARAIVTKKMVDRLAQREKKR